MNTREQRWEVTITGWMQDETFEDTVTVEAPSEDAAFQLARDKMERYWQDTIEIGDVTSYLRASGR